VRALLLLFLSFSLLLGASTDRKIKKSKKTLTVVEYKKQQANHRLEKIATDIKTAEDQLLFLEKKVDELGQDKNKTQEKYRALKVELKKSKNEYKSISGKLKKKHDTFVSLLSEQFSINFAMKHAHETTRESVISQEVYQSYKTYNEKVLAALKLEIDALKKYKNNKKYILNKTQKEINSIVKKKESFESKKLAQKRLLRKLSLDEKVYNTKLEKIVDKQNLLRDTLAKLDILHNQEVEESRKQAMARKEAIRVEKNRKKRIRKAKAKARAKARRAKIALRKAKTQEAREKALLAAKEAEEEKRQIRKESSKKRNINSSYHASTVFEYKGGKTISPIPGAKLIKKFGTYIDPIYKIKIFNESITLRAPHSDAKVQNVLNGKVVYAGKSSMLGKVVVVAHGGKMHTVYAGLSKIAPNLRTGAKIRRGYVIGKVAKKLMFQATKNSKHINPLRLIKI